MRIGVDLGGTKIEALALADAGRPGGSELVRRRVATPRDYDDIIVAVAELVRAVETEVGPARGVGCGTPGTLSPTTGLMRNANTTCLNGRPLDRDLSRALNRPVVLENDANCFALSEATDGSGAGHPVVFGVILGTGVGGGIVAHGRLLPGLNAVGGEWGHNPLPWPDSYERPGPPCYCGKRGCIETFLNGAALRRELLLRTGNTLEVPAIAELAAQGQPDAVGALETYCERLARALASIINVLDPHVIVLGGGLSNLPLLYSEVPRRWARWVFSDRVATPLVAATWGDSSGVRGAARLVP
ncbi:MAG: ROK family protein [Myxococcota bacterium]